MGFWLRLLYRLFWIVRRRPQASTPVKTFRQIRTETVAENLDVQVIGVLRGLIYDQWEASIEEIYRATQERDGVFSVSKSITVGELLELHPEWYWSIS